MEKLLLLLISQLDDLDFILNLPTVFADLETLHNVVITEDLNDTTRQEKQVLEHEAISTNEGLGSKIFWNTPIYLCFNRTSYKLLFPKAILRIKTL